MKILFTICGRAGSKGIKNKNIRLFCGRHLAHYSIATIDLFLNNHPEIEADIVVSSDSEELIDIVSNNGMRFINIIIRDGSLAGDTIGKIDVINDCLIQMGNRLKTKYDMVVDLDITSPLRTVGDLEKVIKKQHDNNADVTITVTTARRNPYFNQVKKTDHGVKRVISSSYTARQQAPEVFDMNASIYAFNPMFLSQGRGVLDGYCEMVEMYDTGILDLDHDNDFELMEVIAEHLFKRDNHFRQIFDKLKDI